MAKIDYFFEPNSLASLIIGALVKGPQNTIKLLDVIKKLRPATTRQGFYRALRSLRRDGIIVIHNKFVSLNVTWLESMGDFFSLARHFYLSTSIAGNFMDIKDGEKIKYFFNNPIDTDNFWDHALFQLLEIASPKENWFAYNPHAWFFLVRQKEEKQLMKHVNEQGRKYLLTSGGKTLGDKTIIKEFNNNESQYAMLPESPFDQPNYYLNIIGDFLVEVWLNLATSRRIENWYRSNKVGQKDIEELGQIIRNQGKTKMTISRSASKSAKLKKKLSKNFYLKD